MIAAPQTLLIDSGTLHGLVATLLTEPREAIITFAPLVPDPDRREAQLAALRRRHDLLGLADLIESPPPHRPPGADAALLELGVVLAAAAEASARAIRRIVWPVHLGEDLDALAAAFDRSRLLAHLLALHVESPIELSVPLLDLTDAQVADLALDLDAPLRAAHWCDRNEPAPCARCASCRRWGPLLERRPIVAVKPAASLA